jgi:predicted Zn-dependent protease
MNMKLVEELSKRISQEDAKKALSYLKYYGYIANEDISLKEVKDAIADFQGMFELNQGEELSVKDISVMNMPRCGVSDRMEMAASLPRWGIANLTYFISGRDSDLSQQEWDTNIANSFKAISSFCNLTFTQVQSSSRANIVMGVGRGRTAGFDGSGGTLAYAYLPRNSQFNGQSNMYHDSDERWVNGPGKSGIWHYPVTLHELLHIVGLSHTNTPNSIMNPTYSPALYKIGKWEEQELLTRYGRPKNIPTQPPAEPIPQPEVPDDNLGKTTIIINGNIRGIEIPGYRIQKIG